MLIEAQEKQKRVRDKVRESMKQRDKALEERDLVVLEASKLKEIHEQKKEKYSLLIENAEKGRDVILKEVKEIEEETARLQKKMEELKPKVRRLGRGRGRGRVRKK